MIYYNESGEEITQEQWEALDRPSIHHESFKKDDEQIDGYFYGCAAEHESPPLLYRLDTSSENEQVLALCGRFSTKTACETAFASAKAILDV